jgi:nucleoside-diphosphate-sugar epimerase
MRIAVTGASGFIGGHLLAEAKAKKWECSVFDRRQHNLLDLKSLKSFVWRKDAIIHLAAVQRSTDIQEMYRVNVLGTKTLLDATVKYSPAANFIFASSFHVYSPNGHFAYSKILAEDIIRSYGNMSVAFTNSVILRFTNIYGRGGKPFASSVVATFAHQITEGVPVQINGDGRQRRDYLHIVDAVSAVIKAVEFSPEKSETVDICTGRQTTLNELLETMARCSKRLPDVTYTAAPHSDHWRFKKNYRKAKKLLSWEPRVSLEHGLKEIFKK